MKKVVALLLVLAMIFIAAACTKVPEASDSTNQETSSAGPGSAEETKDSAGTITDEDISILVMPKLIVSSFFDVCKIGALQCGEDYGFESIFDGPTDADATVQATMVEDYVNKGIDGLNIAVNDAAALSPALQAAAEKGVAVCDWDSLGNPGDTQWSCLALSNQSYAQECWDALVMGMGEEGQYAIVTGTLEAENLNTWIDLGLKYAAEKYPKLQLVTDPVPSDEDQQKAYEQALNLLVTYPDLKGIIGFSMPAPIGAAQAVREKGMQDQITVCGSAMPSDAKSYMEDGSLDYVNITCNPAEFGYFAAYIPFAQVTGIEIVDGMYIKEIDKTISLEDDGKTLIMGGSFICGPDEIGDLNW